MNGHTSHDDVKRDLGSASIMLLIYLTIVLAGAALIFDGGNYFIADRHASNTAEAAARAAIATGSPASGLNADIARQAAVDHATAVGIPAGDVTVTFPARDVVIVTITERRNAVFVRFTGSSTIAATAQGRARLEYS
jgi:Flp pilus assembly protein TadG